MRNASYKNAHAGGASAVCWVDGGVATAGADGAVRRVRGCGDALTQMAVSTE